MIGEAVQGLEVAGLDGDLAHVIAEAQALQGRRTEPAYVSVLVNALLSHAGWRARQREAEAGDIAPVDSSNLSEVKAPASLVIRFLTSTENARRSEATATPASRDTLGLISVEQATEERVIRLPALNCPGATWAGDPEDYQGEAANVAVTAGISIAPWSWIDPSCGDMACLDVKHFVIRSPRRLQYPPDICIYCGDFADTRDHLLPVTYTGVSARRHVLTVPACRQCNSFIGDAYAPSITERRAIAHSSLRRKRISLIRSIDYTEAELNGFGHALKSSLIRAKAEKEWVLQRLDFPGGDEYDLHYLVMSGIEDPYALGLLKTDDASRDRRR